MLRSLDDYRENLQFRRFCRNREMWKVGQRMGSGTDKKTSAGMSPVCPTEHTQTPLMCSQRISAIRRAVGSVSFDTRTRIVSGYALRRRSHSNLVWFWVVRKQEQDANRNPRPVVALSGQPELLTISSENRAVFVAHGLGVARRLHQQGGLGDGRIGQRCNVLAIRVLL